MATRFLSVCQADAKHVARFEASVEVPRPESGGPVHSA